MIRSYNSGTVFLFYRFLFSPPLSRVACVPRGSPLSSSPPWRDTCACSQQPRGLSGGRAPPGVRTAATNTDRPPSSRLPDAVVLGANWAALAGAAARCGSWKDSIPPRLVGAVSIPAAIVAVALALSSGSGVPTSLRPLLAAAGAGSAVDASLAPDARKSFHLASIAYCVAMTSLTRGYPFGLVNLLDAANTAGPMLMEPENVAALGAWCFAVITGVLGLMKTPGGEEGRGTRRRKNMDKTKKKVARRVGEEEEEGRPRRRRMRRATRR